VLATRKKDIWSITICFSSPRWTDAFHEYCHSDCKNCLIEKETKNRNVTKSEKYMNLCAGVFVFLAKETII